MFVPIEGKDETYRHVHSKFIVTIPSDPKKARSSCGDAWNPEEISSQILGVARS